MWQSENWHTTLFKSLKYCYDVFIKSREVPMIDTCVLHDDYENFAQKYLGIDYDDFVTLEMGLPDEDELEIELLKVV